MGKLAVGSVVLVKFPFSNLKGQKIRPALVLAYSEFENFILCQITSRPYSSKTAIQIVASDFAKGKLPITSYIRPDKIFTADLSIIEGTTGQLNENMKRKVLLKVRKLFHL